jgi:hypothetical protein
MRARVIGECSVKTAQQYFSLPKRLGSDGCALEVGPVDHPDANEHNPDDGDDSSDAHGYIASSVFKAAILLVATCFKPTIAYMVANEHSGNTEQDPIHASNSLESQRQRFDIHSAGRRSDRFA